MQWNSHILFFLSVLGFDETLWFNAKENITDGSSWEVICCWEDQIWRICTEAKCKINTLILIISCFHIKHSTTMYCSMFAIYRWDFSAFLHMSMTSTRWFMTLALIAKKCQNLCICCESALLYMSKFTKFNSKKACHIWIYIIMCSSSHIFTWIFIAFYTNLFHLIGTSL